jgi:hypothetical protein
MEYPKEMEDPLPKGWFRQHRKEIYKFAEDVKKTEQSGKRIMLVVAPVKAGKKEITECVKLEYPDYKAYYLTSLSRKDVKQQQNTLSKYGIETHVPRDNNIDEINEEILKHIEEGKRVLIFWDECDYGSGTTQKLSRIFKEFVDTPEIVHLLISATPEETLFSSLADRSDFKQLHFTPPKEYNGAKYFLENNLVDIPKPFLEKLSKTTADISFTVHALEVMRKSYTPTRNIGCVRVTGKTITTVMILAKLAELERVLNQHFNGNYHGRPFKIEVFDANNEMKWEHRITCRGYTCAPLQYNYLFIINQTCTRGTDLKGWHANLAFWHDARSCKSSNLNTLLQAILRPSHYSSCYMTKVIENDKEVEKPTSQPIRLYVDKAAVKAATGDYTDYKKENGKAPTRTTKSRNNAEYESHESANYEDLKVYFDAIKPTPQPFPLKDSFPMQGNYYMPGKTLGINEDDRNRQIWEYEHAKRLKFQENRSSHYYIIPSYRDVRDTTTLVWVITRKLTKQASAKKGIFKATEKSMYAI